MITALIVFLIWFALACALGPLVGRALRGSKVDDDFH